MERGYRMKLHYSSTGVPYIQFEQGHQLIFSTITKPEHGYKWFCVSGIQGKSGAKKVKVSYGAHYTDVVPVTLNGVCFDSKKIFGKDFKKVKTIIDKYVVDEIFLNGNVILLEKELNGG
jgi:hypothetical protein